MPLAGLQHRDLVNVVERGVPDKDFFSWHGFKWRESKGKVILPEQQVTLFTIKWPSIGSQSVPEAALRGGQQVCGVLQVRGSPAGGGGVLHQGGVEVGGDLVEVTGRGLDHK